MKKAGKIVVGVVVLAGLCTLAAGAFLASKRGQANETKNTLEDGKVRVPVVVTGARQMTFESGAVVSGNVQAKNCALVSARMPGPLDSVFADEGDVVEAGKTQLFQTDSVKLTKAVALARQGLTVAECTVREKQASLEQTMAQIDQANSDLKRYRELAKEHAISAQMVEQQDSQVKQAEAMVRHQKALIELANAELEQANLSLMMAEKDLADSLVLAPISGRICERMKEPGEMAAPGTPIMKIEDPSVLEIAVHIPEAFYSRVKPGETSMRVNVSGTDLGSLPVTYKSPSVHSKMRTFEVQAIVESPPAGVVPGCLAEVSIVLDARSGIGIPTSAIQKRGGKDVAFVVENGTARMIVVGTGRESQGWTEVTATALAAGAPVVTMGQTLVEDGTAVTLVEEGGK
jgi:RND family efflux transporter MFP subunit